MLNIDGIESQTFFCIYLFHFITYKSFKGINETGVFFLFLIWIKLQTIILI